MDPELARTLRRWQTAETAGDDDAADAAFGALFEATVSPPLPSASFMADTMAAIDAAVEADARRARRLRKGLIWAGGACGVLALYFGSGALLAAVSTGLVAALNLLVSTIVWFVEGGGTHSSVWTVLSGTTRAVAAFVAEPKVTVVIVGFQVVAAGALVVLHRLLGADREWIE